ncbi:hypothetical protein [Flavobacterium granuli]|uniref:Uncharacterized protein n=1 Tax=Flavobacterium granuli TaxID=280093 RepID=A0ABU1S3M6_9FLAO|nr:hypothetical protein [Flavobacterium granuli]MDR6845642.1 hypothetical protein [Flavobacterium granuli]
MFSKEKTVKKKARTKWPLWRIRSAISPEGWGSEAEPLCACSILRALSWLPFYAVSNENVILIISSFHLLSNI